MNRIGFQKLAHARLKDTEALLEKGCWSGAYYFCGYVVECGLKACLLRHIGESSAVFGEKDYIKSLTNCWTHDLVRLVTIAGLDADFGAARGGNATLEFFWGKVKDWSEASRYKDTPEAEARALYEAVSNRPDGVFEWLQTRW